MWKHIHKKVIPNWIRKDGSQQKKLKLLIKNNTHYLRNRNTDMITTAETILTETHFVFLKKMYTSDTSPLRPWQHYDFNWELMLTITYTSSEKCLKDTETQLWLSARLDGQITDSAERMNSVVPDWRGFPHFLMNLCASCRIPFLYSKLHSVTDWITSAHLRTGSQNTMCGSAIYYS